MSAEAASAQTLMERAGASRKEPDRSDDTSGVMTLGRKNTRSTPRPAQFSGYRASC